MTRTTAVRLSLQALVQRLLLKGALTVDDLTVMRGFGLNLAADMREHGATGAQVGAARIEREIMAWWEVVGAPEMQG